MAEIVPIKRQRRRQQPLRVRRAHLVIPRVRPTTIVSLALVAGLGLIGAFGFLTPDRATSGTSALTGTSGCHPSYVGRCLPIGYDLDCADVGGTVTVVGPDVYRLDADHDGQGCEPMPRND